MMAGIAGCAFNADSVNDNWKQQDQKTTTINAKQRTATDKAETQANTLWQQRKQTRFLLSGHLIPFLSIFTQNIRLVHWNSKHRRPEIMV